ncbi:acyltransferase family protein [Gordonia sp. ABSL11-1]|uniref:acyltransferase family protein n=1 Tax=Gordonia sp. ABSL11-1 TaxID=3053924 RepID=UPI002573E8EE|nr:acyltransferase family protein [Gordonia sp. ABSL11-1]MDL9948717.1 acyltransferase family protein [Gordonia sp. ABSL11-1]
MTGPAESKAGTFFGDIAGLRGVAVLLVVLFHAHVPFMTGGFVGVDIFFVISGFLITRILLREYENTGSLSFKGFYARRARRIIPAAALVIVVSIIAAALCMPLLKVFKQAIDLLAAAAQLANWHFISQNADYLAGAIDGSLATHFWSLSIEEQIYFVWPLAVFGAAALATRTALRRVLSVRVSVGVVVGGVTAASFISALRLTPSDPALAYMATYSRAWQFGVGALVAVLVPVLTLLRTDLPRVAGVLAWVAGWIGLGGVVAAAVTFDAHTRYPGTAALLPTFAAALVIAAGQIVGVRSLKSERAVGSRSGRSERASVTKGHIYAGSLLATPPLRFLGRVSYAWYLWHWPAIVLFETTTGTSSWPALLGVSAVALVIATLSTIFFEEPIIGHRELRRNASASISVGVTGVVVGLAVTMTAGVITVQMASRDTVANAALSYQSVFGQEAAEPAGPVVPNPFQAYDDRPEPHDCLIPVGDLDARHSCVFGAPDGVPVVLFGDSHADQWSEAVRAIGATHGWRIHQFTKAACPAQNLPPQSGVPDPFAKQECAAWRRTALDQISALRPEIIVFSSLSTYVPSYSAAERAWDETLSALRRTGARLVYIADTPYPGFQIADCISGAMDNWHKCDFELDGFDRIEPILDAKARGEASDITTVSVNDLLCEGNLCFAARNRILFYRDDSHLTATAAQVLEPALIRRLDEARFDYGGR